jgi:hypothetical protein
MIPDAKGTTIYCPSCAEKQAAARTEPWLPALPPQSLPTPSQPPVHTIHWSYSVNLGGDSGPKSWLQKLTGAVVGAGILALAVSFILAIWTVLLFLIGGAVVLFTGLLVVHIFKNSFKKPQGEAHPVKVHPIPQGPGPPP